MARLSRKQKRFLFGMLTALAFGWICCLLFQLNLFQGFDLKSRDFLYTTSETRASTGSFDKITIVTIDDTSLEQLGHFSYWPRAYHAEVIDSLAQAKARTIVLDILFSEPTEYDAELAQAIEKAGNVILPVVVDYQSYQYAVSDETAMPANITRPVAALETAALETGHANMRPDSDGIVRRLPMIMRSQAYSEPALALTAVGKYLRRPEIPVAPGDSGRLEIAGREIPLVDGNMLINYIDSPASGLFTKVSYADVLNGAVPPEVFEDKIVIIGVTAIGLGDTFWTPLERVMSGVEIHASAIQTILAGNFLKPAPAYANILIIVLLSLFCGLAVLHLKLTYTITAAIGLYAIFLFSAFISFDQGVMLNILYPQISIAGSFVVTSLYNFTAERMEKNEITSTFGKYVSPSVAATILDSLDNGSLKMGGEERTVTIMLADARNFTGISEDMNPAGIVSIMNRYLAVIIDTIIQHHGIVNKFGGDSIMAVWNAPLACQNHAALATRAALRAQHAILSLQCRTPNLPEIEFGIGVNTGNAMAGNMGSADRLEYSVIGDAVNVAARLAEATPGGAVWIGEDTFTLVKDCVRANPLDRLFFKGKRASVQAYDVLSISLDEPAGNNGNKSPNFIEKSVTDYGSQ